MTGRTKRLADMMVEAVHELPDEVLEALSLEFRQTHPDEWAAADRLLGVATDAELERASHGDRFSPAVLDRLDVDDTERARLLTLLTERGWLR